MTHDAPELRAVLWKVQLRLGAAAAVRTVVLAAAVAAIGLVAWALLTVLLPVPFPLRRLAAAAAGVLGASCPVLVWRLRPPLLLAARVADRRLGLADRLGTAVSLLRRPGPIPGLARLQILDAIASAHAVAPRAVAPIRMPREAWAVVAGCGLLVLWAQFLAGWSLPGSPAAQTLVVVHREGRALEELARRLDALSHARGLPEARRAAPRIEELGRRLESPRIARQDALALLQEASRELRTAHETAHRRLLGAFPRGAQDTRGRAPQDADGQRLQALSEAVRQLQAMTGQLRPGGAPVDQADLARRMRALSDSLDQMGAPADVRRRVETARRNVESGQLSAATGALGDALRDLEGVERMGGDERALGEAQRQVQRSQDKISASGPLGASKPVAGADQAESTLPQTSGATPLTPGSEDNASPPPPGPNQGSLPGQGAGGSSSPPTARPQGKHTPEYLTGIQGEGRTTPQEITAPGQGGTSRLPAGRPPAEVRHEIDRALSREALPPAFLAVIRRYFEALGGAP